MIKPALHYILYFMTLASVCAEASPNDSTVARRWYLPHYLPVQVAGNVGLLSTGLGYSSRLENYQLNLLYGYAPASVAGVSVHTIAVKNIFPLTRYPMKQGQALIPYLGLGVILEVSGNAFFRQPEHYPKGYYDFPKNLHAIGFGGIKIQYLSNDRPGMLRGVEVFAEAGAVDIYLWYKVMSDRIKFNQVFSLALGVNLLLGR